ncbi:MAG: tetratricopeptide repeat protein [Rikenellaceae bacterium]
MRRLLILSLVMLFLVGFFPSNGASRIENDSDSLPLRIGVRLTSDGQKRQQIYGDEQGADSLYRLSIAEDSTYAPAYYFLSQSILSRRTSIDSVIYYSQKAYAQDTTNKWYGEALAQALAMSGRYDEAREMYKGFIEREPENLSAYVMVAMLYNQTSQSQEALAVLDSAEMRAGKNPYVSSMKREILLSLGRRDEAIAQSEQIIELDPESIEDRLILAELYTGAQQDSLALVQLDAAVAIDPSSSAVLNSVAQFHASRGNYPGYFAAMKKIFANPAENLDNKISLFNRITSDRTFYARNLASINELASLLYRGYPSEKQVVELFAQHYIASGNLEAALNIYKKHASDEPIQYDYYSTIIDIESYMQRIDSVELYAARAIELFPDRHELRLSQANLYSYTKRFEEAIEKYEEVAKSIDNDTLKGTIWGYIGDNYHQLSLLEKEGSSKAKRQMRKAYKSYDKSLAYFGANAMVLNNYAYFLSLEREDLGRALDMSGRAIALEEKNPTYMDTYAWVLYELGRYEEAKKFMRQAIALDTTESADVQFHYAEILAKLGEDFMAEVYYDKALKLGYDAAIIEERKSKLK